MRSRQRIVSPVEQRLAGDRGEGFVVQLFILTLAAGDELAEVSAVASPAVDLAVIVRAASPEGVAAIPLEPAERIDRVDPAFAFPLLVREARADAETIQRDVIFFLGQELLDAL